MIFKNKKDNIKILFLLGVFIVMLIWFLWIYPLVIYDTDDWIYISYTRRAIPLWKNWNPARIFPEIFMPLCSNIAIFIFYHLTGDYIGSLTVMSALVVSVFIMIYIWNFYEFVKKEFSFSDGYAVSASVFFLLLHFLVFRRYETNNSYMFYCEDVTCYYYYLIPSLLNASLVFFLLRKQDFNKFMNDDNFLKKGLFCLILYLSIFSNLPASFILSVYSGAEILMGFIPMIRKHGKVKLLLKEEALNFSIIILWSISAVFEFYGGRANSEFLIENISFGESLKKTVIGFAQLIFHYANPTFAEISIILFVVALIVLFLSRQRKEIDQKFFKVLTKAIVCTMVTCIYTILLCAKVRSSCIFRSEYLFGFIFYGFLIVLLSFSYIIAKYSKIFIIIPILLCIIFFDINANSQTFKEPNSSHLYPKICRDIDVDLLEQIIQADKRGLTEMVLYVPESSAGDNWPHSLNLGKEISNTLYRHGVISYPIEIKIEPSKEYNRKYHLK